MHSSTTANTLSNSYIPSFTTTTNNGNNLIQQNQTIVNQITQPAINLISAGPYSSIPACVSNPSVTPMMTSALVNQQQQQQQQPVILSGTNGNYFFAQPASIGNPSVVGNAPFILAPGQANPFVMAQPLQQPSGSPQINCIVRLPDGRLVMQANPSGNAINLHQANVTRLPGPQTAYFPISISSPNAVNASGNTLPMTHLAGPSGQAFYIQMPQNSLCLNNTILTSTANTAYQTQSNPIKQNAQIPFMNQSPLGSIQQDSSLNVLSNNSSSTMHQQTPQLISRSMVNNAVYSTASLNQHSANIIPYPGTQQLIDSQFNQNVAAINSNTNQSFSCLQSVPAGMAVARLPNGVYTTLPQTSPSVTSIPAQTSKSNVSPRASPSPTANNRKTTTNRARSKNLTAPPTDTADVLRRLDEQILTLQRTTNPTDSQVNRLKQLVEVKNQLAKATSNSNATTVASSSTAMASGTATVSMQKPSNTGCVQINPNLRKELLEILFKHNLFPQFNSATEDSFIVEFRLNSQRYQLRLTRAQKVDMERLLFSMTSQRQAEILTVFQQEQSRIANSIGQEVRPCVVSSTSNTSSNTSTSITAVPNFTMPSQPIRLQSGPQAFSATPLPLHSFPNNPNLRLLTTHPLLPGSAIPGTIVRPGGSGPMMGLVAMAMPSMGNSCINNTLIGSNVMSSPSTTCTTALHAISSSPSLSGSTTINNANINAGLLAMPIQAYNSSMTDGSNLLLTQPSLFANNTAVTANYNFMSHALSKSSQYPLTSCSSVLRPTDVSISQTAKIAKLRNFLTADISAVLAKPAVQSSTDVKPTLLELLESLAHYHIFCDADNTDEALTKVDRILTESMDILLQRKQNMKYFVDGLLFKQSLCKLELFHEDRLITASMALDLERDVFAAEKSVFTQVTGHVIESSTSALTGQNKTNSGQNPNAESRRNSKSNPVNILKYETSLLPKPWPALLGSIANLRPLIFDENGKASFAEIELPDCVENEELLWPDPVSESDHTLLSHFIPNNNRLDEEDSNDLMSSDEAEADRLLGLGTSRPRSKMMQNCLRSNGVIASATGLGAATSTISTLNSNNNHSANRAKNSDDRDFEETYGFWQDLMQGENLSISESNIGGLLENSLDSDSISLDEPPNKSSRLFDDRHSSYMVPTVQHSEDPDIDAAIRSILSTSD